MNAPEKLPLSAQPAVLKFPPLKIALLGYRSDPFVGGQGIYIRYLSAALSSLGHQVDVYSGPPYPHLVEGVRLVKVPSLDLYASPNHVRALRWRHLKSYTDSVEWFSMLTGGFPEPYTFGRRISKLLAQSDYDIIHDNQSLCFGLLKLQAQGCKVVSTIHHPIHRDRALAIQAAKNRQYRWLVRRWYSFLNMQEKVVKQLKHVVTVSQQSYSDIETFFHCRCNQLKIIPNGIDTNTFRRLPELKRKSYQLITTASADQPLKGLQFLLQSLSTLKAEYPTISLVVVGKLKPGGATEKLLEKLQLKQTVRFFSGISTDELVRLYAESTIAVCPSLYEGFGLPAGEAMACGLPVVSTDGGALPEVVGDAGIIVPAGNSEALTQALKELLTSEARREALGKMARERVVNQFCWHRVAEELTDYYYSILDSRANH